MQINNDIISIQKKYLEILDAHFLSLWEKYEQSKLSPIRFLQETPISNFSGHMSVVHEGKQWNTLSFEANQLLNDVSSFWAIYQQPLQNALKTSERLNTQIGDLNGMSSYYSNATIRLGLYFDSICLLDPLSIMAQRRETADYYFSGKLDDLQLIPVLLNYLEIRSLKPLLLSETDLPIAILVPPTGIVWGDSTFKHLEQIAQNNTNQLFTDVFNKQVDSSKDLIPVFEGQSLRNIEKTLREHEVFKSLLGGSYSLNELIQSASIGDSVNPKFSRLPLRIRNMVHIYGTIMGIFLALEGAETSAANMSIDLNIPKQHWAFNQFKAKCNAKLFYGPGLRAETPIQAAIMSDKMDWMAAATISDLVKLREKGFMEPIREIYRVNQRELQRSSLENLELTTSKVVANVTEAIQNYKDEVDKFKQNSSKGWFKKISFIVIPGALGIASMTVPSLGLLSLAYTFLIHGESIPDLIAKYYTDKADRYELMNRPITHMLEIWDRKSNKEEMV